MSDYTGIQGQAVVNVSSDPSVSVAAQVWYNSTTGTFKITNYVAGGAWATGGNLTNARRLFAGAGTQTAGLAFGGTTGSDTAATEEFTGETSAENVKTITTSQFTL